MSQLSANELLRKGDKEGWIKKRRELMKCSPIDLENAWKRNVKKYKLVKPDEKTKAQDLLVNRAMADSKGSRFQFSRAFLEKDKLKQKSSLKNEAHLSTKALTPEERKRLTLESMGESKISSKTSKGSGSRKRKTRKRKRRRTKKKRRRKKRKSKKNKRKSKRRR